MKFFDGVLTDLLGRREDAYSWRTYPEPIDLGAVRDVLLLHLTNKLGDAVLISLTVDALAKARPGLPILVGTTAAYEGYWASHPAVRGVVVVPGGRTLLRRISRALAQWRNGRRFPRGIDVLVSFKNFNRPDHFALVRAIGARINVGFNKLPYRLFHHSIDERCHGLDCRSIAERTVSVLRVFDRTVALEDLTPHLPFSADDARAAGEATRALGERRPRALLHVYGSGSDRSMTAESTARALAEMRRAGFDGPVLVSVPRDRIETYRAALGEGSPEAPIRVVGPQSSFGALFALVAAMDLVVSPDTAIGHVAAGFGKPQLTLFARRGNIPIVWRPLNPRGRIVVTGVEGDINGLDWDEFRAAFAEVLALSPVEDARAL